MNNYKDLKERELVQKERERIKSSLSQSQTSPHTTTKPKPNTNTHPPIHLLKLKQNLKSETLTNGPKEKTFIKTLTTTPYTSA